MSREMLKRIAKLEARQVRSEVRSFIQHPGESRQELIARAESWHRASGSRYEPLIICRRMTPRIVEVTP